MANQMIALTGRVPQAPNLMGAMQQYGTFMTQRAQQEAAMRTRDAAQQKMDFDQQMHAPQMAEAQSKADLEQMNAGLKFYELTIAGLKQARTPEDAMNIGAHLKQQFTAPIYQQTVDQSLSSLPQDPAQFEEWRQRTMFQSMQQEKQLQQHFTQMTNGAATWTQATPEYAGGPVKGSFEIPGSRVEAPQDITYIKDAEGRIVPMPKKMPGSDGALVGGPRGGGVNAPVAKLREAIVAQESNGDYTRVSPKGALGAYQVMPATAKTLAGRLNIAWKPELMTSNTAEGRRYQDLIGNAAIDEAVKAGGGDIATTAAYYHGGSDRSKWGPNTRQYVDDIQTRLRSGDKGIQFGKPIEGTGKGPAKPKATDLTPEQRTARNTAVQNLFDAVEAAHKKGHLVSSDQSYAANRAQEALEGRTWLPGGTSKKTSLDDINAAASQLLRMFIQKGTSGTLNTKAEQDMFLRGVGGSNSTYETRIRTIRNFAKQNGIPLSDGGAGGAKPKAPLAGRPPAGVTAEEWQYMTPEERAHWRR